MRRRCCFFFGGGGQTAACGEEYSGFVITTHHPRHCSPLTKPNGQMIPRLWLGFREIFQPATVPGKMAENMPSLKLTANASENRDHARRIVHFPIISCKGQAVSFQEGYLSN